MRRTSSGGGISRWRDGYCSTAGHAGPFATAVAGLALREAQALGPATPGSTRATWRPFRVQGDRVGSQPSRRRRQVRGGAHQQQTVACAHDRNAPAGYEVLPTGRARALEGERNFEPWAEELEGRWDHAVATFAERWGIGRA